ncbi:hypothetical protein [Mesorhizobium sp. M7D.F.Ca.US.005.01.1.1]|uniref:hypothetical protein n=1 Tax=Mesorhizobium sp. M7D.F.Ca.US.005.01.1.1 TaxID=2493678 RepID=UPI0013DFD69A|nr:hypothetical protein [Mesorhizobium sp. M7D.F.Ca.US.005.01.1.1]
MIGRAAGGVQADDAVDDRALVDHPADRRIGVAERGDRQRPLGRLARQGLAQRRAWVDEGRARRVQAHDLHQHLVGIRRAVEGAGARSMVGFGLGLQQFGASCLALGIELADLGFFVIGQAGRHRPGRNEHRRQMAEGEGCDHQPRHDLVADAEIDGGVEHVVRQADRRGHGDDIARKQRQLHAGLALRDAIAHCRHATGHLRDAAGFACRVLDQRRKGLERLMRRQHVVVGGDDAEVRHLVRTQRQLFRGAAHRKAVSKIAARQHGPVGGAVRCLGDAAEIALAAWL